MEDDLIQVVTPACMMCGKTTLLRVSRVGLNNWREGMLIQRAFPEMSVITRELLMTGTHDHCWSEMTKDDEDDES